MKTPNMRQALVILIFTAFVAVSCGDMGDPVEPSTALNYVQGRVHVDFADTVRLSYAEAFFQGLGVEPVYVLADLPFGMVIQTDSADYDMQLYRLIRDTAVTMVSKWSWYGLNPQKFDIYVGFNGTVRPPYALALIASIPGLRWKASIIQGQVALLRVEVGQEQSWIDKLIQYPFITSASLVYIEQGTY